MKTIIEELEALRLHWPQWGWSLVDGRIWGAVKAGRGVVQIRVEAGPESWRATVTGEGMEGAGVAASAVDAVLGASRALRAALREAR